MASEWVYAKKRSAKKAPRFFSFLRAARYAHSAGGRSALPFGEILDSGNI